MYTGFEDMEAVIGELQMEIQYLKDGRDKLEAERDKYMNLFNSVYDERDELKKEVAGLEERVNELTDALTDTLSGIESIGSEVDKLYRETERLTK